MTNPMAMPSLSGNPLARISKVDMALCLCAIGLGATIVLVNHQVPHQSQYDNLSQSFNQLMSRVDLITSEFDDWYVQDTSNHR